MTGARHYPMRVYDCFTERRFGGNLGGVVYECGDLDQSAMQAMAREIGAPVTGFVTASGGESLDIRFFMPAGEIAMCGHVTIGLFTDLQAAGQTGIRRMNTGAGPVPVTVTPGAGAPLVMLDMGLPDAGTVIGDRAVAARALGLPVERLHPDLPLATGSGGLAHLFVPVADALALVEITPDFTALTALSRAHSVATVMPFALAPGDEGPAVTCRDFCPAVGVNEVPASGTTNSALAGYLATHGCLGRSDGTLRIRARQGTEMGRPSVIQTEIHLAAGRITALAVGGQAVLSHRGEIGA